MIKLVTDISNIVNFDYFIKMKYEAGVILLGWEVKCIRLNGIDLHSSFILVKNSNVFIIGSVIHSSNIVFNYGLIDENRNRKLLLKKREITAISVFSKIKGNTIIPSKGYWKDSFFKFEICLCLGKKQYDKRNLVKEREWNIEKRRTLQQ